MTDPPAAEPTRLAAELSDQLELVPSQGAWKVLGWPKRWKLARTFLWEYSYIRLKLAQLLDQLGVFLTQGRRCHLDVKWPQWQQD